MTRLRVQTRKHLAKGGATTEVGFVRCPTDARWLPVAGCRECASCGSLNLPVAGGPDARVACAKSQRSPADRDPERASVTAAMDGSVLCVEATARAVVADAALAEGGHPTAVVQDAEGHAIGVVSRADLASAPKAALVRERMTPFVITLLELATVADATTLILERGLHHVPILCDGKVLGVVSAVGALRWYAQNLRSPRRPRGSPTRNR